MSHGEYREHKQNYKKPRKVHEAQSRLDRWLYRFDREQDRLEDREAIVRRQQRVPVTDRHPQSG